MVIIMLMKAILRKVYDDLFPSVAALPGVARLVHHLAKHQVRDTLLLSAVVLIGMKYELQQTMEFTI